MFFFLPCFHLGERMHLPIMLKTENNFDFEKILFKKSDFAEICNMFIT